MIVGRVVWEEICLILDDKLVWIARDVFMRLGDVENRMDARLGW